MNGPAVIVRGSPVDGIVVHGPFPDGEDAADWAERNYPNDTWWVVRLEGESML